MKFHGIVTSILFVALMLVLVTQIGSHTAQSKQIKALTAQLETQSRQIEYNQDYAERVYKSQMKLKDSITDSFDKNGLGYSIRWNILD